MSLRSTLVLLRLPFGLFLAPIALLAMVAVPPFDLYNSVIIFICFHLFLYPASNGFNSFYDRDVGPIGGLARPPLPSRSLLWASLACDLAAILLGLLISPWFSLGLFFYGLISKAYSHPRFRFKKFPLLSLGLIAFGQGSFTFLLCAWWAGAPSIMPSGFVLPPSDIWQQLFSPRLLLGALLSALFLIGVYPLTQVYQHKEDSLRGDKTYSILVGIRGTFLSSAIAFSLAFVGLFFFFWLLYDTLIVSLVFVVFLLPSSVFFLWWWRGVLRDQERANFSSMMRMNFLAALGMNAFLVLVLVLIFI